MAEITPETKVDDLLNEYPQFEEFLIGLNPKYKKLKNPILRRTVAKIATLTQVAKIGGYDVFDLVNLLRKEVGRPPLEKSPSEMEEAAEEAPAWVGETPKETIDANRLLDEEKNPLTEVSKALKSIESGQIVAIRSDFLPSPLIDMFKEKGYKVYAAEAEEGIYLTYIKKP